MGSLHAAEFAKSVQNGDLELEAALTYHFRSNHFPPLPLSIIPIAIQIIKGKVSLDDEVKLPKGITYRGSETAPVYKCIKAWHLQNFLNTGE